MVSKTPVSLLFEIIQKSNSAPPPSFAFGEKAGTPSAPLFTVELTMGEQKTVGLGKSKMLAKHDAASKMLRILVETENAGSLATEAPNFPGKPFYDSLETVLRSTTDYPQMFLKRPKLEVDLDHLSLEKESLSPSPCHNSNMPGETGGYRPLDEAFATRAIHVGQDPDQWPSGVVIPPIHMGTTFKQDAPAKHRGFDYGRSGNPSRCVLEMCMASLEKAKYSLAFASGLAAANAVLTLLKSGDHVLCCDDVYGGMNRFFRTIGSPFGIETTFINLIDTTQLESAIKPNTKLIWMESPTNPLLKIMNIPELTSIVRRVSKDVLVVVDNTFMTPYLQRPLDMGADISIYSLTKYMNGHSDVIMGAIMTNNEDLFDRLKFIQNASGLVPSPFDCYLVNRSLKTLHVRMKEHMRNALEVATYLESHPLVEKVIYPGLPSHPQHELSKRMWSGPGGMMSFYLKGGLEQSNKFLSSLQVFTLAESLGGFESLAELPSVMTHASVPPEMRQELGIWDNLIRLSVGLEAYQDLIKDLDQALKIATQV